MPVAILVAKVLPGGERMSRDKVLRNINQRIEMYNLFLRVAQKIREEKRNK